MTNLISVITIEDGVVCEVVGTWWFATTPDETCNAIAESNCAFLETCGDYGAEFTPDEEEEILQEGFYTGGNFSVNLVQLSVN